MKKFLKKLRDGVRHNKGAVVFAAVFIVAVNAGVPVPVAQQAATGAKAAVESIDHGGVN